MKTEWVYLGQKGDVIIIVSVLEQTFSRKKIINPDRKFTEQLKILNKTKRDLNKN